jgi:hypothetical protein
MHFEQTSGAAPIASALLESPINNVLPDPYVRRPTQPQLAQIWWDVLEANPLVTLCVDAAHDHDIL